jgi:hypothetical protein
VEFVDTIPVAVAVWIVDTNELPSRLLAQGRGFDRGNSFMQHSTTSEILQDVNRNSSLAFRVTTACASKSSVSLAFMLF